MISDILSTRELEVAGLIATGMTEAQTAERLFISERTVHCHAYNARKKMKVESNLQLAVRYILSLPKPKEFKKYLVIFIMAIMQSAALFSPNFDLRPRRSLRTGTRVVRTVRTSKAA